MITPVDLVRENFGNLQEYLRQGGDPNFTSVAMTPHSLLGMATCNGNINAMKLLLHSGANPNNSGHIECHYNSAMYYACISKNYNAIKLLLDYSADCRYYIGTLCTYPTNEEACYECTELLLDHGANPSGGTNVPALNPLLLAHTRNFKTVAQLLLQRGADPYACMTRQELVRCGSHDMLRAIDQHARESSVRATALMCWLRCKPTIMYNYN